MSNIEHLLENGIQATKRDGLIGFNEAMNQQHNQTMLKMEEDKISKEALWEIVQYIVYSHDECLMGDLKPCPFCGGEAHATTYLGEKTTVHYIECEGCKALMGNPRPLHSALRGKLYFDDFGELVEAWNSRKEG